MPVYIGSGVHTGGNRGLSLHLMTDLPLFQYSKKYPEVAGHQGGDTDKKAADEIESSGRAENLRRRAREIFESLPLGATADEVARLMEEDILSVRPRVTELKKQGDLVYEGERRTNENGKTVRILKHYKFVG